MARLRGDKSSHEDSFGLIALCSIGPILSVILLSIFYHLSQASYTPVTIPELSVSSEVPSQFAAGLPVYLKEVTVALLPILLLFLIFQLISRRFHGSGLLRVAVGMGYTFIGLVTFLTGVNIGFMPAGSYLGRALAGSSSQWLMIPLGMVIGFFIVTAEPAVHVLAKQVEEVSNGSISSKSLYSALSLSLIHI